MAAQNQRQHHWAATGQRYRQRAGKPVRHRQWIAV